MRHDPRRSAKVADVCQLKIGKICRYDAVYNSRILRPTIFNQPEGEDWEHIVYKDNMLHFITSYDYAIKKIDQIGKGLIVGVSFESHEPDTPGLLGFDFLDGYFDISLLTNWGNDISVVNSSLGINGLISDYETARAVHQELKSNFAEDEHVPGSTIIALFDPAS